MNGKTFSIEKDSLSKEKQDQISIEGKAEQVRIQAGTELGQAQPWLGLKVRIWGWGWITDCNCSLKFKFEKEVWRWNLRLMSEVEVWNWSLKLKFEVEVEEFWTQINLKLKNLTLKEIEVEKF